MGVSSDQTGATQTNMDISACTIKLDHSVGNPEPLVNWRQSVGFPVFGCGQPTEEGFKAAAEKLNPKEKVVWFNMRQEPVAYVGGLPVAPRASDAPHTNVELSGSDKDLEAMEVKFVKEIASREKDGAVEVHKDAAFAENPMDREDVKESLKAEGLKPFNEQRALPEAGFDIIVSNLSAENAATWECVFSSQLGAGRSTLGMVIASIVKAAQMMTKLHKMVEAGMAEKTWAENIIKSKFEDPLPSEDNKDPFLRGEFDVIKQLLSALPETVSGKVLADKMIDICGTPPEGFGLQNLRKAIIQMEYKYDASTEDKQIFWKTMIINYLERYFYLICFATYVRQNASEGFKKSFSAWLEEHRTKLSGPDYREKLGMLVSDLYKLAFQTYHDIPRGPIKDNLMRKLACKTLMEILPSDVSNKISQEIADKKLSIDFDTVVGLVVG